MSGDQAKRKRTAAGPSFSVKVPKELVLQVARAGEGSADLVAIALNKDELAFNFFASFNRSSVAEVDVSDYGVELAEFRAEDQFAFASAVVETEVNVSFVTGRAALENAVYVGEASDGLAAHLNSSVRENHNSGNARSGFSVGVVDELYVYRAVFGLAVEAISVSGSGESGHYYYCEYVYEFHLNCPFEKKFGEIRLVSLHGL